jgi:LytS/YehU family sensor histidine kinase
MEGQRGSCWVLELFLVRIRWLSKIEMQREMRMRNQVSMFLVLSLISMLLELSGTRVRDS